MYCTYITHSLIMNMQMFENIVAFTIVYNVDCCVVYFQP